MYNHFFGLERDAYRMTPDPSMLFLTRKHREALAGLTYAIFQRKGFAVLTGDAGTGKTTLISQILESTPSATTLFSVILNSTLTPSEFLELAMIDFGIKEVPASKAQRLQKLQELLIREHAKERRCVLIVDEAHKLSPDVLEELRLLSNFELAHRKLLQIVMCGQTELDELLNRESLRQLKQRIEVRLQIEPLTAAEVEEYIRFRWTKAGGGKALPFEAAAVECIRRYSKGVPRLINSFCENSLVGAYSEGVLLVSLRHVQDAVRDLGIADPEAAKATTPDAGTKPGPERPASLGMISESIPLRSIQPVSLCVLDRYSPKAPLRTRFGRMFGKFRVSEKTPGCKLKEGTA